MSWRITPGSGHVPHMVGAEAELLARRLNDVGVELLVRIRELHDHEHSGGHLLDCHGRKRDLALTPGEQTDLTRGQGSFQHVVQDSDVIDFEINALPSDPRQEFVDSS